MNTKKLIEAAYNWRQAEKKLDSIRFSSICISEMEDAMNSQQLLVDKQLMILRNEVDKYIKALRQRSKFQ